MKGFCTRTYFETEVKGGSEIVQYLVYVLPGKPVIYLYQTQPL